MTAPSRAGGQVRRLRPADESGGLWPPPGPALPVLAQTAWWGARPIEMLDACARRYGDVFRMRLAGGRVFVVVSDPGLVGEIFTADPELLRPGVFNWNLDLIFGSTSLPMLDGSAHLHERRLLLPPFHGEHVARYEQLIEEITRRELALWPRDETFGLYDRMLVLAFRVIMRTVFGIEDEGRRVALTAAFGGVVAAAGPIIFLPGLRHRRGPLSPWTHFERRNAHRERLLLELIRERRTQIAEGHESDDILTLLMRARHEDGTPMADGELSDRLKSLIIAGYTTTASTLAWFFSLALAQPAVVDRLKAEFARGETSYLDATIKETQRMRPTIVHVGRAAADAVRLDDWRIPAGAFLVPSIHLVHRRPDAYPEPDRFRPERFLDTKPAPYSFIPFGGGTRRCLGANFAMMEMRVAIRTILERVDLRLERRRPEQPVRLGPSVGPRTRTPVTVTAQRALA